MNILEQIRQNAFFDELEKLGYISVYDPKKGKPKKPLHYESAEKPILHVREDAAEQGGAISSNGSPMSTGE